MMLPLPSRCGLPTSVYTTGVAARSTSSSLKVMPSSPGSAGAAAALASAHSILVLGYSFPASDRMMRYFFASALEQNNVLQRIVFIDPNAGHIRAANRDFLESPNIRNLVSYFPCKWEEIDLHIVQKIASGEYVPNPNDSVLSAIQQSVNARDLIRRGSEP